MIDVGEVGSLLGTFRMYLAPKIYETVSWEIFRPAHPSRTLPSHVSLLFRWSIYYLENESRFVLLIWINSSLLSRIHLSVSLAHHISTRLDGYCCWFERQMEGFSMRKFLITAIIWFSPTFAECENNLSESVLENKVYALTVLRRIPIAASHGTFNFGAVV